jgi:hypothetical protein
MARNMRHGPLEVRAMLMGQSVPARRRALLACDGCGRVMREVPHLAVDDFAAAAMRAGWRVKSADAAGARWLCPLCADSGREEPGKRGRSTVM